MDLRWLWTAVPGACIVAFAFWEIFQDLFHPALRGSFSDRVGRSLFRLFRRHSPSLLSMAGPLTLVIVIFSWALLQAFGFALIYWMAFPQDFELNPGTQSGTAHGFWMILYYSLEVMTTLGLGDVMPKTNWLRLLTTFQALMGFALLTASLSYIVLIYPALGRLRSLARRTEILVQAAQKTGIDVVSGSAEGLIGDLTDSVIQAGVDFIHFPLIYYFHSDRRQSSLAHSLPDLLRFAKDGSKPDAPDRVRLAAATLQAALEDLARVLSRRFLHASSDEPGPVFDAYIEDHILDEDT
ncbi:MAG TPA: ion channel [Bryobacteraceae bacterium]|nr:ion channel [Bryobacteraceae bacterium]